MTRTTGKLTSWDDEKGFGFISTVNNSQRIFVHIKAFRQRHQRPGVNQQVKFTLTKDQQGRPCATKVDFTENKYRRQSKQSNHASSVIWPCLFIMVVTASVVTGKAPAMLLHLYLIVSLITFCLYGFDKNAAQKDRWRTSESTLHLWALAGGWPGAFIAQQTLRHKTRKKSFRLIYWYSVIANCALFIWLLSPKGSVILNSVVSKIRLFF